jgi:hypothetical protein
LKLGNPKAAMEWIEKLKEMTPMTRQLKGDPNLAPLRENAPFREIAGIQ